MLRLHRDELMRKRRGVGREEEVKEEDEEEGRGE